jgi:hypothetical protein
MPLFLIFWTQPPPPLPIVFHVLDHIKIRNLSEPVKNSQIGIGFKASPGKYE